MTRKKKSRSLKRIHSVKTGNISKLKRAGTTDRQSTNLKAKDKPKSVYQKFLDENPDAVEKQIQPAVAAKTAEQAADSTPKTGHKTSKADNKNHKDDHKEDGKERTFEKERKSEKEPDLLSQLDNKNFNDFY